MTDSRSLGRIILVNGASSSGKTTLCRSVSEALDEPFWHFSFDHLRNSGMLPIERFGKGAFDWQRLRPSFFSGFHECLAAWARTGNDLIVEHIIETKEWQRQLALLLVPFDVFTVVLRCPIEELERREEMRGDRRPGEARADFESIYGFAVRDLELDSTDSPQTNTAALLSAWRGRRSPSALAKMASELQREAGAAQQGAAAGTS